MLFALLAALRTLSLCLLSIGLLHFVCCVFAGNTCPHGQAYLRTCSVASHCGHTFLKRIYIPDCRVPSNRFRNPPRGLLPSSRELPVIGFYRACAEYKRTRKEIKWRQKAVIRKMPHLNTSEHDTKTASMPTLSLSCVSCI